MGRQGIEGKGVFPGNDRLKAEADYVDTSLGHTVTVLTVQYSGDGAVERTPLSYPRRYVSVEGGGRAGAWLAHRSVLGAWHHNCITESCATAVGVCGLTAELTRANQRLQWF